MKKINFKKFLAVSLSLCMLLSSSIIQVAVSANSTASSYTNFTGQYYYGVSIGWSWDSENAVLNFSRDGSSLTTGKAGGAAVLKTDADTYYELSNGTEYHIQFEYKVTGVTHMNEGDSNGGDKGAMFIAPIYTKQTGGDYGTMRNLETANRIQGELLKADNSAVKVLRITETSDWKTAEFTITTAENLETNEKDAKYFGLAVYANGGKSGVSFKNIKIAKTADLPTVIVKDANGETVDTLKGISGEAIPSLSAARICTYYDNQSFTGTPVTTFGSDDQTVYVKYSYYNLSDFTSSASPYNMSNFKIGGSRNTNYASHAWFVDGENTLRYKLTYGTTANTNVGQAVWSDKGNLNPVTVFENNSGSMYTLQSGAKYIIQIDYEVKSIDTANSTSGVNVVFCRLDGNNILTDRRKMSGTGTLNVTDNEHNLVTVTRAEEKGTVSKEFTVYDWANSTASNTTSAYKYLGLAINGFAEIDITNIKVAKVSSDATNEAAQLVIKDGETTIGNNMGFPGDSINLDNIAVTNAEILSYTNEDNTPFTDTVYTEGIKTVNAKYYMNIGDYTSVDSAYSTNNFKNGNSSAGDYSHVRWSVDTENSVSGSDGSLKYKMTYADASASGAVGNATGNSGGTPVAVEILSGKTTSTILKPATTYTLQFKYKAVSVDTASGNGVNYVGIYAVRKDTDKISTRILNGTATISSEQNQAGVRLTGKITEAMTEWKTVNYTFTTYNWATGSENGYPDANKLAFAGNGYGEVLIDDIKLIEEEDAAIIKLNISDSKTDTMVGFPGDALTIKAPVIDNKKFQGWYEDAALATPFVETSFGLTGSDTELFAKWNMPGDANDDGVIDIRDLVRLKKYFCNISGVVLNEDNADIIENSVINSGDMIALVKMLLGVKIEVTTQGDGTLFDFSANDYSIVTPKYNMSYLITKEFEGNLIPTIKSKYNIDVPTVIGGRSTVTKGIYLDGAGKTEKTTFTDYNTYVIECIDGNIYIEGGHNYAVVEGLKTLARMVNNGYQIKNGTKVQGKKTDAEVTAGYSLTANDEFNGDELSSLWTASRALSEGKDGTKDLLRTTGEDNLYLEDGYLHERGSQDNTYYYSSRIQSNNSLWFQYGYTEISGKLAAGEGFWSCFYLFNDKEESTPEYDIAECYGDNDTYGNSNYYRFTPHAWLPSTVNEGTTVSNTYYGTDSQSYKGYGESNDPFVELSKDEQFADEFHTFGFEWDADYYRFTCDGRVVGEYKYSDWENEAGVNTYRRPVYVMLALSVGNVGGYTKTPVADFSTLDHPEFVVDWFHLYQLDGQVNGNSYEACAAQIDNK